MKREDLQPRIAAPDFIPFLPSPSPPLLSEANLVLATIVNRPLSGFGTHFHPRRPHTLSTVRSPHRVATRHVKPKLTPPAPAD